MRIKEFLQIYLYKQDVQDLAEYLRPKTNGVKDEIINRI